MNQIFLPLIGPLALTLACGSATEPESAAAEQQLAKAKTSLEAGKALLKLLADSGRLDVRLQQLAVRENPTVAVHAYWKTHNVKVPRFEEVFGGLPQDVLEPRRAHRFFGFLEAKARVLVPWAWQQILLGNEWAVRPAEYTASEFGMQSESGTAALKRDGHRVRAESDSGRSVLLPAAVVQILENEENRWWNSFAVHIGTEISIVALYNSASAGESPIFAIDSQTGELKWKADLWAAGEDNIPSAVSGPWQHRQELRVTDQRVAVFGTASSGSYVEVFDVAGRSVLRFSTNLWNTEWNLHGPGLIKPKWPED